MYYVMLHKPMSRSFCYDGLKSLLNLCYTCIVPTVAEVGFSRSSQTQVEDVLNVTVCIQIFTPNIERPIAYPFDIGITTADVTAGKFYFEFLDNFSHP